MNEELLKALLASQTKSPSTSDSLKGLSDINKILGIAGASAPLLSTVGGLLLSADERKKQQEAFEQTAKLFQEAGLPPDVSRQLALQQFQTGPLYSPTLEQEIALGPSAVAEMQVPGVGRETQMEALEAYKQLASLGLSPTDRASLNKLRDQVASQTEGKRQQILQQMQQRGLAGSGQELAAQLASSQAGAEQASEESDRLASLAFEGRRSALSNLGNIGGQVRSSDFSEEAQRRAAQDLFQRYATENSIARQQRNVGSQNQAQLANIARQQNVMDLNTGQMNAELDRQNKAKQDYYNQMLARSATGGNIYNQMAQNYGSQAANIMNSASGLGTGFNQILETLRKGEILSTNPTQPKETQSTTQTTQRSTAFDPISTIEKIADKVGSYEWWKA